MSGDVTATLREHFGFDEFLPGQREVIEHLLDGNSAAAVFPTGGGKSLCYQLPALMLPGVTLVVSPLIALMKDQIDALAARRIDAVRLDSTLSADEYRDAMDRVRSGSLRLLYVSPERFNNERFRELLPRIRISLFAVDEAHCISEWGHNFRPDYLKLAGFAKHCGAERVLALTATATEKVLDDVCRLFEIAPQYSVRTGFYRPNLTLLTTPAEENRRDGMLRAAMDERPPGSTIVYVTLQRTAQEVAERLRGAGYSARHYHAGMKAEERAQTQEWFMQSDRAVVVATIAFGMGIDKADIRYVYHYNMPKSLENYAQEIGRAGRDGVASICRMFVCSADLCTLENFVCGDTPTREAIARLLDEVFLLSEDFDVSAYELSSACDIRLLVVRTLLTYLELDGYLEGGTPFYASYQFQPLAPSKEILSRFDESRREFLAAIFRQARKAKTWFHIDVDKTAQATGSDRQRVVRALDYLGEQQLLNVRAAGVRLRFRRLRTPKDCAELAGTLHRRTLDREAREIARLHQVVEFAQQDACQVASLGAHFGDPLPAPCGHCSWCLSGEEPLPLPERRTPVIDPGVLTQMASLRQKHPEVLSDARAAARLLCGVTSPKLIRAKLTKVPLFGSLDQVPFAEVLARLSDGG